VILREHQAQLGKLEAIEADGVLLDGIPKLFDQALHGLEHVEDGAEHLLEPSRVLHVLNVGLHGPVHTLFESPEVALDLLPDGGQVRDDHLDQLDRGLSRVPLCLHAETLLVKQRQRLLPF
jgi:hypothetical protein